MSGLLTVEDFNSVESNPINSFYALDTKNISLDEFNNVLYDFCIVNHSISGTVHTFTFEIHNSLWNGRFYVSSATTTYDSTTNTLTVRTSNDSIILYLILNNYSTFNLAKQIYAPLVDYMVLTKKELGTSQSINLYDFKYDTENTVHDILNEGINIITYDIPFMVLLKKTDVVYDLSETVCTTGIVNHVPLNVDADYLPDGDLVDTDLLDIIVKYNDSDIPVQYDESINDYCFNLDLTDKIDNKPINLLVQVNETDVVNASNYEISLNCTYPIASSFNELQSKIVSGAEIIELDNNIEFTNNLIIPHDIYIIGNDHIVDLNIYHIDIQDKNIKCESINFMNGASCFIQKNNSRLVLNSCKFYNAINTDNYKGSVISSNSEEVTTDIINCFFRNCHHTVYTGGDVNVDKCSALYNEWNDKLDVDYSAFLTAFNGDIEITNSTFDIDYVSTAEGITTENIKFAQSLIGLSQNCTFNGTNVSILDNNNTLPFFNNQYNNRSHIWIKYYYPNTESIVVSSPTVNNEDKSVCHTILGVDWVFKNNVQVTNPDNANNIRKIKWE